MARDKLYSGHRPDVVDFVFDESVAEVFPDMIRRSVPGYETIISMIGCIAEKYACKGSTVYDLGCSLGAVTLSMASRIEPGSVNFICIDNSPDMITRCQANLEKQLDARSFQCVESDICDTEISDASVVVMNFSLQFLDPGIRDELVRRIYSGLLPGGVLILSEKVGRRNDVEREFSNGLYQQFKKANGYSDLEISQKRSALERVMILNTVDEHLDRMDRSGFSLTQQWFQALDFCSFIARK
jgi:tRNA (cmo5U34)-methyltransferase